MHTEPDRFISPVPQVPVARTEDLNTPNHTIHFGGLRRVPDFLIRRVTVKNAGRRQRPGLTSGKKHRDSVRTGRSMFYRRIVVLAALSGLALLGPAGAARGQ